MRDVDSGFLCVDCGVDTSTRTGIGEYYAVRDDVWVEAGMRPHGGMLCVGCLEDRLGRRLDRFDFKVGAPVNWLPGRSDRLADRFAAAVG